MMRLGSTERVQVGKAKAATARTKGMIESYRAVVFVVNTNLG